VALNTVTIISDMLI